MQRRGVKDNREVCTALLEALGGAGMVEEAARVWRRMVLGPARRKADRQVLHWALYEGSIAVEALLRWRLHVLGLARQLRALFAGRDVPHAVGAVPSLQLLPCRAAAAVSG